MRDTGKTQDTAWQDAATPQFKRHGVPDFFLDCVVALGSEDSTETIVWNASGFLYGHPVRVNKKTGSVGYQVYLVTNRHVFTDVKRMFVRCNPRGHQPAREFLLELVDTHGHPRWLTHARASIDVAVIPINFPLLREHASAVKFFVADRDAAPRARWRDLAVAEGNQVYVLGFPMGLVGGRRNTVIVRSGALARVHDTIEDRSSEFLVDVFVFPGNSGGPILLSRDDGPPLLIGLIRAYVPYQDVAISLQTQSPRVIFEENSGLASAHPIDCVTATIRRHRRLRPTGAGKSPTKPAARSAKPSESGTPRTPPRKPRQKPVPPSRKRQPPA